MNQNKFLYERGFYITNNRACKIPFGNPDFWAAVKLDEEYVAHIHKDTKLFVQKGNGETLFLIGHAYNPCKRISDENELLGMLLVAEGEKEFFEAVNELTGIFLLGQIKNRRLMVLNDAAGIQCVSYGKLQEYVHIASHTHMLEDVCGVKQDGYVTRLVNYRFYPLFGKQLPGDITPYKEFKRLVPNHCVIFSDDIRVKRFWPVEEYRIYKGNEEEAAVKRIATLLHDNLRLIAEKWEKPAISMTGGCDSKTTLACAKGLYDKFRYFSYSSQPAEKVDAEAARTICSKLGLKHLIYEIPEQDSDLKDIETVRKTLRLNAGDIGRSNPNDVRKRAFFAEIDDFDVEVKSWVSECGRAYYNKRFKKRSFPKKPTPQYLTSLYKVFLTDRKLVKETNRVFQDYMNRYMQMDNGGGIRGKSFSFGNFGWRAGMHW